MLKAIKRLFRASSLFLAIATTIGIAVLSLAKMEGVESSVFNYDKFLHAFAYCTLSFFWLSAINKTGQIILVSIICVIYGIIIEILQMVLTNYRSGDLYDALANTSGVLIGYFLYQTLAKKYFLK